MAKNTEDLLKTLSGPERDMVLKILKEYSESGSSKSYTNLIDADFKEAPVDIITFVKDNKYLGKAWHLADGTCKLFPFWEGKLKELFPDPYKTNFNNFIESGARGLGKSEIAITCGLYLMHRLMCLKNPHEYLNLKPTEKVAFAFMNITKILAEEIGISKFQATVQMSPWFMDRGTLTQRNNEPYWNPPDFINMIIGSQASHVIGQPIYFCLDGDTNIITDSGVYPIKQLEDKKIRVYNLDSNNNAILSNICTAKMTNESSEEYQIELEDGTIIKCTPNHRFMLKNGEYKEAQYLTEADELVDIIL